MIQQLMKKVFLDSLFRIKITKKLFLDSKQLAKIFDTWSIFPNSETESLFWTNYFFANLWFWPKSVKLWTVRSGRVINNLKAAFEEPGWSLVSKNLSRSVDHSIVLPRRSILVLETGFDRLLLLVLKPEYFPKLWCHSESWWLIWCINRLEISWRALWVINHVGMIHI